MLDRAARRYSGSSDATFKAVRIPTWHKLIDALTADRARAAIDYLPMSHVVRRTYSPIVVR